MRGKGERQRGEMVIDCEGVSTVSKETFKEFEEVRSTWHQLWERLWFSFQEC